MSAFPSTGAVTLRTNLGDHPGTRALKSGAVRSGLATFDFCGPKVANEGFKPMLRESRFDAGELAIVTFLQAKAYGKPWVMLPAAIVGRAQHHTVHYNAARGPLAPRDLAGRRVGTRSYTVTTGVWVRGILQDEYGLDPATVTWCGVDDAHLAEYREPSNVERLPPGAKIEQMLLDGALDGAILGGDLDDPRARPLIPDPHATARAWSLRHGFVPVNHLFVVHRDLAARRPDVVRDIYRALRESREAAGPPVDGPDPTPFGIEQNRKPLELIVRYAFEQKIIPRKFSMDELFEGLPDGIG